MYSFSCRARAKQTVHVNCFLYYSASFKNKLQIISYIMAVTAVATIGSRYTSSRFVHSYRECNCCRSRCGTAEEITNLHFQMMAEEEIKKKNIQHNKVVSTEYRRRTWVRETLINKNASIQFHVALRMRFRFFIHFIFREGNLTTKAYQLNGTSNDRNRNFLTVQLNMCGAEAYDSVATLHKNTEENPRSKTKKYN